MDLSIIIVNWNTADLINDCINSIKKETCNLDYEIIVLDNASQDHSFELITKNHPEVLFIKSEENLGFSKGNNAAISHAKGKYLLLLNPDTLILDKAIEKCFRYIKELSRKCLVGCKLLNRDKTVQISSAQFPTILNLILGNHPRSLKMHMENHETDWVMGAFMMIETNFYKEVGGLDEDYFMYSEDLDLCFKVKKNGGKVYYFADAEIVHLYNQSGFKKWNNSREKRVKDSNNLFFEKNISINKSIIYKFINNSRFMLKSIIKRSN